MSALLPSFKTPVAATYVVAALAALFVGWILSLDLGWMHFRIDLFRADHIVALILAGAMALIFITSPRLTVLTLIAVCYTNASEVGVRFHGLPSILQLVVLIAAASWFYQSFIRRSVPVIVEPIVLLMGIFALIMLLASSTAVNREVADAALFEVLKNAVLVFLVINLVRSTATLRDAVDAVILSACFLGLITVYQVGFDATDTELGGFGRFDYAHIVGRRFEERIAGPMGDPNYYAQILAPVVPLAMLRARHCKSWLATGAFLIAAAVIAAAMILTYSRAAQLVLVMIVIATLLYMRLSPRIWAALIVAGAVLLALSPNQLTGRLKTLEQLLPEGRAEVIKLDSSFEQRKLYMGVAWEIFKKNPIIGVGAGNYADHYVQYTDFVPTSVNTYKWFDARRFPHSLYLEIAAETGLIGLTVFALTIFLVFCQLALAAGEFIQRNDRLSADLAAGFAFALVSYLATSIFLHADYIRYLWLLVALSGAAFQIGKSLPDSRTRHEAAGART